MFISFPSSVAYILFCSFIAMENIPDNVAVSVDQFYTIRAVLMASIEEEEGEEDVKEEQR